MRTSLQSRILLSFLTLLMVFVPLGVLSIPKQVHAIPVEVVADISFISNVSTAYATSLTAGLNTSRETRETFLNGLAWFAAKALIRSLTRSIVNWINTGFEGSPAFVTDPGAFLTGVVDEAIGSYINSTALGFLCSPFQLEVRIALALNYKRGRDVLSCRLSQIGANIDNFFKSVNGSFAQGGGWNSWFQVVSTDNPYTRYQQASTELEITIANARGEKIQLLAWGKGFFSFEQCRALNSAESSFNPGKKQVCKIHTPGSFIEQQLSLVAGSDLRSLELADSINEILGALAMQLVSQALGGIGGLLGASNSSGGGPSLVDQIAVQPLIPPGAVLVSDSNPRVAQELTYKSYVTNSLDRVRRAEQTLSGAPSCAASSAAGIIATRIAPLKAELEAKVREADENIAYLRDLDRRVATASSTQDATRISEELSRLSQNAKLHDETELVMANMQTQTIANEMSSLEQQIASEGALCSASAATSGGAGSFNFTDPGGSGDGGDGGSGGF